MRKNKIEYVVDDTETYELLDLTPEECDILLEEEIRKIKEGNSLEKEE